MNFVCSCRCFPIELNHVNMNEQVDCNYFANYM